MGKLRDGARSVQRTIKNNFLDSNKQEAIDILLLNSYVGELGWKTRALLSPLDALGTLIIYAKFCSISIYAKFVALLLLHVIILLFILLISNCLAPLPIRRGLCNRWLDFTKREKLRVCVGTWNVNGGKHIRSVALKNQSLHDWLLNAPGRSPKGTEHVRI